MTNAQYIEKILATVERILVDTSTLMTPGFQQFIINNKERLLDAGKEIIVPKAVYTELARHMDSTAHGKCELAMAAVELLALNKDVFHVESAPLTEDEIAHAFADAQLLSELTLHRSDYNQLLITNDRKLSCDAFDLNQQQSCKGRRVLVCYINWLGELQCCECARSSYDSSVSEPELIIPEKVVETAIKTDASKEAATSQDTWEFDWLSGLMGVSGIGLLYGIYKGGQALLKNIA